MQPSNLAKRLWLFLFIALGGFYLWGIGSLPLVGPDEPRYAEVAREMFVRRDWITPALGGLPWFEKPALLYWMTIASYRVFGVNEFAARLGPAICGLLTAVFIYCIGRSIPENASEEFNSGAHPLDDRFAAARWSAFVFLTSLGVITFSRGASFDIVLTMTVTGTLAFFFIGSVFIGSGKSPEPVSQRAALVLIGFYFFLGLSLLAKGLAGPVIVFGSITTYYVVRREWPRRPIILSAIWGVPLSLAVAAIWYGPMIARHGYSFIDQFVIQHHFARFASNKYHHPQPIYYYPLVLLILVLPWTISFVASLFSTRRWNWRGKLPLDRARVLMLAWLVVPTAFFTASQSKLPGYILPVLPACALLIGERIACFCREGRGEKVIRASGVLLIVLSISVASYATQAYDVWRLWVAGAAFAPTLVGIIALVRPKLRAVVFLLIGIAVVPSSIISLRYIAPVIAARESVRDLLSQADARGYGNTPIVQLHTIERTAEFYAAGRISYGSDGEPVKFEGAPQVLEAAHRNGSRVLCFVPSEYVSQLTALPNVRIEVIGDNGRVCLAAITVN